MGSLFKGPFFLPSLPAPMPTYCLPNCIVSDKVAPRLVGPADVQQLTEFLPPSLSGRSTQLTLTVWLPYRQHIPLPRRLGGPTLAYTSTRARLAYGKGMHYTAGG